MDNRIANTFLLISLLLLLANVAPAAEVVTLRGNTMGTTFVVSLAVEGPVDAGELLQPIELRLAEINQLMSTYVQDSEVVRFNRFGANRWFPVSEETAAVVAKAKQLANSTDGAFDITVGPLVRLWKFGAGTQGQTFAVPDDATIAKTLEIVGSDKLDVRQSPPALLKQVEGLEIDLSAIAKGYAVDQVAAVLENEFGISNFMVEIGGEMVVRGKKPNGDPWRIGVESPIKERRELHSVITPENTAVASSGNYRNFHELNGKTYSHTIDPRTGRPVRHLTVGVTVLSEDCATADALATALMVMGPAGGRQWADKYGVAALFVKAHNNGSFNAFASLQFPKTPSKTDSTESSASFATTLLAALLVFAIAVIGMSIGVIVSNRQIKGSCGGMAGITDEHGNTLCDGCTNPSPECQGEALEASATPSDHVR